MADNQLIVNGVTVRTKDIGAGVQMEFTAEGPALSAGVIKVAVTTTAGAQAFAANTTSHRARGLKNTGTVVIEISPTATFGYGNGIPLAPGEPFTTNYVGIIYAAVSDAAAPGELRMWWEH